MAKRFTESEKWKKTWFRKLKPELKCFWIYILDNCNHAGIWEYDLELASFMIGTEITPESTNELIDHIEVMENGKKWFIKDFVRFQYGVLNPNNNAHVSVLKILKHYNLSPCSGAHEPLPSPCSGAQDKDKDKDKDKLLKRSLSSKVIQNKKEDKKRSEKFDFESAWNMYPKKIGKKEALGHFNISVKTKEDFNNVKLAIKNYCNYIMEESVEAKFIKAGCNWFADWECWVDYKSSIRNDPLLTDTQKRNFEKLRRFNERTDIE